MKSILQKKCWLLKTVIFVVAGSVILNMIYEYASRSHVGNEDKTLRSKIVHERIKQPVQTQLVKRLATEKDVTLRTSVKVVKSTEASLPKQYDCRIIVMTCNRHTSLARLLESLNNATYDTDHVKIEIWIDRDNGGIINKDALKVANGFTFKHGDVSVNPHKKKVGLYGQWLTTFNPDLDSKEIGVLLEDDLTVSPYFYRYLKLAHKKYDSYEQINGYTLQSRQMIFDNKKSGQVKLDLSHRVFLYPVLGSWGFSPSNKNWNKFQKWYFEISKNTSFNPVVRGNRVTDWYMARKKPVKNLWTIWHVYYSWINNEYVLYSNFKDGQGLAGHWAEKGLNYRKSLNRISAPLLQGWTLNFKDLPDSPIHVNISGNIIS